MTMSTIVRRGMTRLFLLALLCAVPGAAAIMQAAPAHAAGCYRDNCDNKDPQSYGCASTGKSLEFIDLGSGTSLQFIYSPGCDSQWALFTRDFNSCCVLTPLKIERQAWTPYGWYDINVHTVNENSGSVGRHWTPMVPHSGDTRARACWSTICTGWKS